MLDVNIINKTENKALIKMRKCPPKCCEKIIAEVYCDNCDKIKSHKLYEKNIGVFDLYPGINLITANDKAENQINIEADNYYKKECYKHKEHIEDYLDKYGVIDAARMIEDWFPKENIDLFISHSHNDINVAYELKRNLEKLGINAFVDYFVWDSVYDLLKAVDDKYSLIYTNGQYDYQKRNSSTSNLFTILLMELFKKMNEAKGIIFINTSNSIMREYDNKVTYTQSPWIYAELLESSIIMSRQNNFISGVKEGQSLGFKIKHYAKLNHLVEINYKDMKMNVERLINESSYSCNKKEEFFSYIISKFKEAFIE